MSGKGGRMSLNYPSLTIITPTYNRKDHLPMLYESLCRQTCQDFQWLVIDDGSTDGTDAWFALLPNTTFLKEYQKKENGGKHTALNYSHPYIKGKWMTIVDSDDFLKDDAVEVIIDKWKQYEDDQTIGGITFQRHQRGGGITE